MDKNRVSNLLFVILAVFIVFFFGVDKVDADSIKIKSVSSYSKTVAHHRVTTTGLDAFCLEMPVNGPTKGMTLKYGKTYTKGMYVYIVNNTSIAGTGSSKKNILTRQHAIWLCQGRTPGSNYKTKVHKDYAYYTEANKLCNAAKKAGDNFTIDPTISIANGKTIISEYVASKNYDKKKIVVKVDKSGSYVSTKFTVSPKDITGNKYKLTFTNAPEGTKVYTVSDGKEKELKAISSRANTYSTDYTSVKNFIFKTPASKITSTTNFEVEVTANTSKHKTVKRYVSDDYQDLAVPHAVSETPKAMFIVSLVPDTITITKLDADSGESITGAKFRIFSKSDCTGDVTNFTDTYVSDSSGFIKLYGLTAGTYYVKEVTPPPGYNPPTAVCQKVITNNTVTFRNKRIGIVVKKVDIDTNEPVSGAKYAVYTDSECKTEVTYAGTKTTNFEGLAYFYGISNGTYYVKELEPPTGYLISSSNCLAVESNHTIVFKNKRKIKIKIKKVDADTKEVLAGAKYKLFSDSDCSTTVSGFTNEVTTDKDGWAYYEDVPNGVYYVKETSAPEGYALPIKTCLKVESNNEVTFENRKNTVKVYKVDTDNDKNFLAGATYQIYSGEGCHNTIPGFTVPKATDKNGVVEFVGLPEEDMFSVKEVSAPAGYDKPSVDCQNVRKNGAVTFKNKMNNITVFKKDAVSGDFLAGAVFGIYSDSSCNNLAKSSLDGATYDKLVTPSNGRVIFSGMNDGTYYIKEETPPEGYYAMEASRNCKSVETNKYIVFENSKNIEKDLIIQKRDSFTNFGIDGVKIGLYSDFSCSNQIQEGVTANGQVVFHVAEPEDGETSYFVKENEVPNGYVNTNVECKSIKNGETVVIKNVPYGEIKVLKMEEGTSKPIKGVTFRLLSKDKKEVTNINGDKVPDAVTDDDGVALFRNIRYGEYYIVEVKPNVNYKMLPAPVRFILNEDTDAKKIQKDVSVSYRLGDANDDGKVNSDDLTIYQNLTSGKTDLLGLSPKSRYSIDVNKDGNDSIAGLNADMKIVQYYLTFANKKDKDLVSDAKSYNRRKKSLCAIVGDKECSLTNVNYIYEMDKEIKATKVEYLLTRSKSEAKDIKDVDTADIEFSKIEEDYNKACPDREYTVNENGTPKAECQVVPEANLVPIEDTCSRYSEHMPGDVNGDCEVDKEDVVKLEDKLKDKKASSLVNADLNHDKKVDYADLSILTDYANYKSINYDRIMKAIATLVKSKQALCEGDVKGCNIDEDMLELAITKVGKLSEMDKEIASSSIIISNKKITIRISKQSITNSKEIPGARIIIKDLSGKTIISYISDAKVKEFEIPAGRYSLTETVSPRGYKALQTSLKFEVESNGNVKFLNSTSSLFKIDSLNHIIVFNRVDAQQQVVVVPNTASEASITSAIVGVSLILGGVYLLYASKRRNA